MHVSRFLWLNACHLDIRLNFNKNLLPYSATFDYSQHEEIVIPFRCIIQFHWAMKMRFCYIYIFIYSYMYVRACAWMHVCIQELQK
jgi:hypothetical protein